MRRENWHTCECRTLEAQEKKNADLDGKTGTSISEIEILKLKSELAYRKCEMCVEHEENYKWLSDRYDEELDENLQQHKQVTELEKENEKLKDELVGMRW
jgi:hypothetical protein